MSPTPPRRPTPASRAPQRRPRRVAGQGTQSSLGTQSTPQVSPERTGASAPPTPPTPSAPPPSPRLVRLLVVVIVLLAAVGAAEVWYLTRDDAASQTGAISAERPVRVSQLEWRSVVDQAARAAETIVGASSTGYDDQVEEAASLMTDAFAEQYRSTKADVKDDFLAAGTEVTVDVSAQGVVSATPREIVALLFLTQSTSRTDAALTSVQFRVTVTMVDTPEGWLVSDLQAS